MAPDTCLAPIQKKSQGWNEPNNKQQSTIVVLYSSELCRLRYRIATAKLGAIAKTTLSEEKHTHSSPTSDLPANLALAHAPWRLLFEWSAFSSKFAHEGLATFARQALLHQLVRVCQATKHLISGTLGGQSPWWHFCGAPFYVFQENLLLPCKISLIVV